MADIFLVSASIIMWKAGDDGQAELDVEPIPVSDVVEAESDDQIKLKLLARWLKDQNADNIKCLLEKVAEGLLTVEIQDRDRITPPVLPQGRLKPEEYLRKLVDLLETKFGKAPAEEESA